MHKNSKNKRIVFFGTPDFAVFFLQELIIEEFNIVGVVTAPDKKVGRKQILTKSPIKKMADEYKLSVLTPKTIKNNESFKKELNSLKPDVCILVAYGKIIPKDILDIPELGFLNIHPSKLPKYRGPAPIQYALLNGDRETAITLMKLDEEMDTGGIYCQLPLKIEAEETAESLHDRIGNLGAKYMSEKLSGIFRGELKTTPQNNSEATYSHMISRDDAKVDFSKSAKAIAYQGRAFFPWPGLYTTFMGKRLKLILPNASKETREGLEPGNFFLTKDNEFAIITGRGSIIPKELLLEGKKQLFNKDFVKGYGGKLENLDNQKNG